MKKKIIFIASTAVFLAVEDLLGYLLQVREGREVAFFSFLSIILACAFFFVFFELSKDYFLTQAALICTVCADYFLVWLDPREQLPAMIFFSFTQLFYFARIFLADENKTRRIVHISLRAGLSAIAVIATLIVLGEKADAVALVSLFYYANLAVNIIFALAEFKKHYILAIGLVLFLLCDTVIGLTLIGGYLTIPADSFIYKIIYPGFNLAWVFYLPSQALIASSLLPKKLK